MNATPEEREAVEQTAAERFEQAAREAGYILESTPIDKRPDRSEVNRYAAHVRFTIAHKPSGRQHSGHYSAGSECVRSWALAQPQNTIKMLATRAGRFGQGYTIAEAEALDALRMRYQPSLADVLGSMFMDCAGFEPGMDFREWLREGIAPENAADALECFQAIEAGARFLRCTAGDNYDRLAELAGDL